MNALLLAAPTYAEGIFELTWLLVALPLVGAAVILTLGTRLTARWAHWLGCATVAGSFLLGLTLFITLLTKDRGDRTQVQHVFDWINVGDLYVGMDLRYDQLSALFVLLITGVGGLIHLYSVGYMEHDPRRARFFGYLNLFVAAMLTLVLADNYLVLFLGWEGVGLASYLLIGFWQHKPSAAAAAKKAFVMNRVGDVGMALAMFLAFTLFGTLSISGVSAQAVGGVASETELNILGLLLLLGACGKSAQVPLQAWLLDAMEGPTPVSALIHAATMVTAGVYLVVRSNAVFDHAPIAQTAVITVAVVSLLWGAVLACAKDDIKKALAGSTMSQIGYMMLGAGLGPAGYAFAIFHLITHGFFKANMFLGAGSVMHAMDDDVDMRHYGGLARLLPVTFLTFAMGYLAIIGFPGFSGFWSKDKIIEAAFGENLLVGFLALLGGVLAIGGWISDWLAPVVGEAHHPDLPMPVWALTLLVVATVALGVAVAWFTVGAKFVPRKAPADPGIVVAAARADLYGDAINDVLVVTPTRRLTEGLIAFDRGVVDGVVMGQAAVTVGLSQQLRKMQNGFVRSYALSVLGGALLVVLALMVVNW